MRAIALRRDVAQSNEAAMKYYVLGALASGFLLYGISMLYGATGSLDLNEVFKAIGIEPLSIRRVLLFGVIFIVAGVAFKMGAVPFHMWVPDVYQGAPTAMTLMVGGGPKVAAFAWGLRFLVMGLLPLAVDWQEMLVILAALSLIVGNITGIVQRNVKRMLAYSAISNMGFVLLGLLAGVVDGKTSGRGQRVRFGDVLQHRLPGDDDGHVRRHHAAGTPRFRSRYARRLQGPESAQPGVRVRDDDHDVLARRHSAGGRLLREARGAASDDERRSHMAGRAGRDHLAVRRVLLPAYRQADVLRRAARHQSPISADACNRALLAFNGVAVLVLGIVPGSAVEGLPAGDPAYAAL